MQTFTKKLDLYSIRTALSMGQSIYDLPLRVTYYARVSTEKDYQLNSFQNQIMYFENKIKSVTNWNFIDGYWDEGISGTSMSKRENFNRMINDANNDVFDLILTKEVSRFARNTVDTLTTVRNLLNNGVGVLFETDNINTLSNEGELRLTIMSSLAQDESRKLSERTKFGFKRSIERGRVLGSDNIWGYKKDSCKLVIVEEEAEIVRKIYELYSTGRYGMRRISQELANLGIYADKLKKKKFSFSTIKGILTNPKYKGYYCGNKTTKIDFLSKKVKYMKPEDWVQYKSDDDSVPAIVSEDLWEKCQKIYTANSEKVKNNETSYNNKYTYSGKIFCKNDGMPYWRTIWHGKTEVWQCSEFKRNKREACPDSPTLYKTELDFIMKMIFDNLFKNKEAYIEQIIEVCKIVLSQDNYRNKIEEIKLKILNQKDEKKKIIKLYAGRTYRRERF